MAIRVAGFDGSAGSDAADAGMADCAISPAVMAVLALRKSRRLLNEGLSASFGFMRTS